MAPKTPRLKILSVGGNAVSAFLSWRLQATNACDVTLVWKSGYEHVAQYGISFRSPVFGNERFKPRHVVRAPEDASVARDGPFDYVILCIKALPDVYDLAAVIESVVTPQHTCILVNATHTLGVESAIEDRFPTNVVLSLVAGAELSQLGQSEFEHKGSTEIWVGPSNRINNIPASVQDDMAQALAMTLSSGQVDCRVSPNIRQQQFERVIGPIAFHPISVIFDTPNHLALVDKIGVREMISDVIDELLQIAQAQGCKFPADFKQTTMDEMTRPTAAESIMWQDYVARRPMEVETYLGSPIKIAREAGCAVPRIETLYAIIYNLNIANRQRPKLVDATAFPPPSSPSAPSPLPRISSSSSMRPMMSGMPNGNMSRQVRPRNSSTLNGPGMRRPPHGMNSMNSMNGMNGMNGTNVMGPPNGYGRFPNGPPMNGQSRQQSRRGSMEGADLEEFSHLMHYDDIPEGGESTYGHDPAELALRDRELQLRQRELALREQEMRWRRPMGPPGPPGPPGPVGLPRRGPHPIRNSTTQAYDDDDDDDEYVDPTAITTGPAIDPDNFDMMSVTSRKHRKVSAPSPAQFRRNLEQDNGPSSRGGRFRPSFSNRNRSSQLVSIPNTGENMIDDQLLSCSSNRYGTVDRSTMQAESRTNSLTNGRLEELQHGPNGQNMMGPHGAMPRRASQSPGNLYGPPVRGVNGRPSPPNGYGPAGSVNGRPLPSEYVRQPVPQYPPGQGNSVAPQQVEQRVGVSSLSLKPCNIRSLTGSASASAASGETQLDSGPSSHSSQNSLQHRPPIGVR